MTEQVTNPEQVTNSGLGNQHITILVVAIWKRDILNEKEILDWNSW